MPKLSIVMPVLNEADTIREALSRLAACRKRDVEVIVADGGSSDGTPALAAPLCDRVIAAPRGRASQMNAGAGAATGDVLMFLHCDCILPDEADRMILNGLAQSGASWGRFDISIAGRHPLLPVIATMMNWRSRVTGIATGDQAVFVRRDAFAKAGQFPAIALMEDIALSRSLKRFSSPLCLRSRVIASARRWEKNGVIRTMMLMWRLRLGYVLGESPERLARIYGYAPSEN